MRITAFGYSTHCNVRCEHCVAKGEIWNSSTMDFERARSLIHQLAEADVKGISFTAGEPILFPAEIAELIKICSHYNIYTRVVTNAFWAKTAAAADALVIKMKASGLSQLRISFSRWHQKNINRQNVLNAALSCIKNGLNYYVSFVTDFSDADEVHEDFLRENNLTFFPEPLIFSGPAEAFEKAPLKTDYQENRCPMNPYISPDLDMYACCDAGSHFTNTNFFYLGNLNDHSAAELFQKSEKNTLFNHIRNMGITPIASFAGFKSGEIIRHRKCELCKLLFDSPERLKALEKVSDTDLANWHR